MRGGIVALERRPWWTSSFREDEGAEMVPVPEFFELHFCI